MIRCVLLVGLLVGSLLAVGGAEEKQPVIRMYVFSSPDCADCAAISAERLEEVSQEVNVRIECKRFDPDNIAEYQKLNELEAAAHDTDNQFPVVFIGRNVLGGPEEIDACLETLLRDYARARGVDWPDALSKDTGLTPAAPTPPSPPAAKPVFFAFFRCLDCRNCERAASLVKGLPERHPNVVVLAFDLAHAENRELKEVLAERYRVTSRKRVAAGALVVGGDYLSLDEITDARVEALIARYTITGSPQPWRISEQERLAARWRLHWRVRVPVPPYAACGPPGCTLGLTIGCPTRFSMLGAPAAGPARAQGEAGRLP